MTHWFGRIAAAARMVALLLAGGGPAWGQQKQIINEQGGIGVRDQGGKLPVRIIYYDDKSDPKTSVKWYEKLATDDKVDFFLGAPASPIAYAATAVAEKYQIPMVLTQIGRASC